MISTDGTVLCVFLVDFHSDRLVPIEKLLAAFVFVWTSSQGWKLHYTMDFAANTNNNTSNASDDASSDYVAQVQMTGDGQRLIIFEDELSFRVHNWF